MSNDAHRKSNNGSWKYKDCMNKQPTMKDKFRHLRSKLFTGKNKLISFKNKYLTFKIESILLKKLTQRCKTKIMFYKLIMLTSIIKTVFFKKNYAFCKMINFNPNITFKNYLMSFTSLSNKLKTKKTMKWNKKYYLFLSVLFNSIKRLLSKINW